MSPSLDFGLHISPTPLEFLVLLTGLLLTAAASSARAALPGLVEQQGRDPAQRRREAGSRLRILWLARVAGHTLAGSGCALLAGAPGGDFAPLSWAVLLAAYILLSEVLPAWLAHNNPDRAARVLRLPMLVLRVVFTLPAGLFLGRNRSDEAVSEEWAFTPPDIMWLEQRREKGDAGDLEKEQEMVDSVLSFSDRIVREVMVPRIDMVSLPLSDDLADVVDKVRKAGHSRIPVYREKIDDIEGVLYTKDLLDVLAGGGKGFHMKELLREAYFVPEYKSIDELFREFQAHRIHMAIVVDEYGGTAGIVTMEDLVEEVFGEIRDEYDTESPLSFSLGRGAFRVDGRLPVDDLNDLLDTSFEEDDDYETVAGLVYRRLGHIPRPGEAVTVEGHVFTVEKVRAQRILLLKVAPSERPD